MEIEVAGRNVEVTPELRAHVEQRFAPLGRQVSPHARLNVCLREERNPAIPDKHVVEVTLGLKGVTLRACESSPEMISSINRAGDDLRRQVKRHREKRRKRSLTRRLVARDRQAGGQPAPGLQPPG